MTILIESLKTGVIVSTNLKNYKNCLKCAKYHLFDIEGIKDNTKNKELIIALAKNGIYKNKNFKVFMLENF